MSDDAIKHLRAVLGRYKTNQADSVAATETSHELPGAATLRRGSPEHFRDLTYALDLLADEASRGARATSALREETASALHEALVRLVALEYHRGRAEDDRRYGARVVCALALLAGASLGVAVLSLSLSALLWLGVL